MSIRPHKTRPGAWIIDFYPQGRKGPQVRRVFEGTEAEARAIEQSMRRQSGATQPISVNPPINSALPEYLEWHGLHRAASTHRDLLYCVKWMMPHFGALPVSQVNQLVIHKYQVMRSNVPRACNKEIHYLMGMITWMVKRGMADPLPFKPDMLPYRRPLPQPPPPGVAEKILAYITDSVKRALVLVLYESGCRWTEAASLRWEDIDFELGKFRVLGKGNRMRFCMLSARCREILEPIRQASGPVFVNARTGKIFTSLKNLLKNASAHAGVPHMTPHKLRHAFATDLLSATGDLRLVQTALGHQDVSTTTIYAQVAAGRLEQGAFDLDAYRKTGRVAKNGVDAGR